jgi:hypothetical protein
MPDVAGARVGIGDDTLHGADAHRQFGCGPRDSPFPFPSCSTGTAARS